MVTATLAVMPFAQVRGQSLELIPTQSVQDEQIVQNLIGRQVASQSFTISQNAPTVSIRQAASNAANSIEIENDAMLSVSQHFDGQQLSINDIVLNAVGALESISQDATNISGVVVGGAIGNVEQVFADGAGQHAANSLALDELPGSVRQSGANTTNLIHSRESVAISSQNFSEQASQVVNNFIKVTGKGGSGSIVQEGANLGNVIVAGTVGEVVRDFSGDQIVSNMVMLEHGSGFGSIVQSGLNIANYIEAESIGKLRQTSTGRQVVENSVQRKTLEGLTQEITGVNISQTSSNFVNVIALRSPVIDDESHIIDVIQAAEYDQDVTGSSMGTSQTGNSATIER